MISLPDGKGSVEVVKKTVDASSKTTSGEVAFHFLQSGNAPMSPGPASATLTVGKKVVTLKSEGDALVTPEGPSLYPKGAALDGVLSFEPRRQVFKCSPGFALRRIALVPIVTVEGEKSFEVEPGKKLVLAIEDAGIDIMHRCGGNARCTTCRVQIVAGEPSPMEGLEQERLAREPNLEPNTRLSCQIRVESDLGVVVVNRASQTGIPAGTRPLD